MTPSSTASPATAPPIARTRTAAGVPESVPEAAARAVTTSPARASVNPVAAEAFGPTT
ncbi:hypothetical protein [Actinoplanes sichuanensis]|uniref:hypothetical protein n=1 Tax=Actinoplanes sichuanensis TaxID=512349 RepID=UPI0029536BE3|nr:hypothetical protein [Actinoplanes sichuanensis]